MNIHNLKIKEQFAREYFSGVKRWELRKNDRNFKIGDSIIFEVINEAGEKILEYNRRILYVFDKIEYGLQPGYVILTISAA